MVAARMTDLDESAGYFDTAYFEWQGDSAERSARAVVPLVHDRSDLGGSEDFTCESVQPDRLAGLVFQSDPLTQDWEVIVEFVMNDES